MKSPICPVSRIVRSPRLLPGVVVIFALFLLSSCSTYRNVTAYFNTYYNASKLFSDAERQIQQSPQPAQDTNHFAEYSVPKTITDNLDKVIEKCSKIIQNYPNTTWMDDAIMMVGKSYFYKGENQSALREFEELITNFPESGFRFEAKLWAAKSLYLMKKGDEVINQTKELFGEARQEGKNDILLETLLLQGQVYYERGDYDLASQAYAPAVEVSGDDNLRALAAFRLASCYELSGDKTKAENAYARVAKFHPDFSVEFRARLKEATLYSSTGEYQKSLDLLEDLKNEPLKNDQRGLVELGTANTLRHLGDTARAFQWYTFIDTAYAKTDAAARSYYECGKIYEKEYLDFKNALKSYDKARNEFPASEITPVASQKYITLTHYFNLYGDYHNYDTLLVQAIRRDSMAAKGDTLTGKLDSLGTHADSLHAPRLGSNLAAGPGGKIDSVKKEIAKGPSDTTAQKFLPPNFSIGKGQMPPEEDAERDAQSRHRRGGGPPDARNPGTQGRLELAGGSHSPADSLGRLRDSLMARQRAVASIARLRTLSPDSLRYLLAMTKFELAGLFYLEFNDVDSATYWYKRVTEEDTTSPFVPKALYALSEIFLSKQDSAAADSVYDILLKKYTKTEYAHQVRVIRHLPETTAVEDSVAMRFIAAEGLLRDSTIHDALREFEELAAGDTNSSYTPKAMYTVGWIFETKLVRNDSAAKWYKQLLARYPSSDFAAAVQPKVAVRENPKSLSQYVKIKEIIPLKAVESKADSLAGKKDLKNIETQDEDQNVDDNQDDEELQQGRHGTHDDSDEDDNSDDTDDSSNTDDNNN